MIGGNHGEAAVVRKPGEVGQLVICRRNGAFGLVRERQKPEAGMFVVFVRDVSVVLVFFFFFFGFGLGVRSEKRDGLAVERPFKAADVALALGERSGFAATHREKINLLVGVAIGEECQQFSVG